MNEQIQLFLIYFPAFLFAISFHESAHGWVAYRFGDDTAKRLGRISLNPIRHMDFIGTFLFPVTLFFSPGLRIPIGGWAKPVPVNPLNMKNPRRDNLWVAFAGPISNIILALLCAGFIRLLFYSLPLLDHLGVSSLSFINSSIEVLYAFLKISILINLGLAFFNLIPFHPLDGGKVIEGLLPASYVGVYNRIANYGFLFIFALYYLGAFRYLFLPVRYIANILIPV